MRWLGLGCIWLLATSSYLLAWCGVFFEVLANSQKLQLRAASLAIAAVAPSFYSLNAEAHAKLRLWKGITFDADARRRSCSSCKLY